MRSLFLLLVLGLSPLADGVFAGDCGGRVSCECGDTVVRRARLTKNLGPCSTPYALKIAARAYLDGRGFRVSGNGEAGTIGILVEDQKRGYVRDVKVERFQTGLLFANVRSITLRDTELSGNQNGIEIYGATKRARIRGINVHDNTNIGLYADPAVTRLDLQRSEFSNNRVINIFLDGSQKAKVSSVSSEGAMIGLVLDSTEGARLHSNQLRDLTLIAGNAFENRFYRDEMGQLLIAATEVAPGVVGYPVANHFSRVDFDAAVGPCIELRNTWDNVFDSGSIRCGTDFRHVLATADALPEGISVAVNRTVGLYMPRVLDPIVGERSSVETDENSILDAWYSVGGVVETSSRTGVVGATVTMTNVMGENLGVSTTGAFGLTEERFLIPGFFSWNNQDFVDVHVMRASKSGFSTGSTEVKARQDITYLVVLNGGGGGTLPIGNPYPSWFPQGSEISACPVVPTLRQVEIMAVGSSISNNQWVPISFGAFNAGNHGGNIFVSTLEFGYALSNSMTVNGIQMEQIGSEKVFCQGSNVIGGWVRTWRLIGSNVQSGTLTYQGSGTAGSQASKSISFN